MTVLLVLAFLMPFTRWNWLTELIIVVLYFPTLIGAGAGAILSPGLKKLCVFLGRLFYPLYMTHYGAMWIFGSYLGSHKPDTLQLSLIVITGTIFLGAFAYLVLLV